MAGQGTAAKELIEEVGPLDVLIAPLGGGGLLSGSAIAAKAMNSDCTVIGVEPEAGDDGQRSLRSGTIVHIDIPKTIADGAQTQHLGQHTFPVIQQLVEDILTVNDGELIDAMKFFVSRMKMIVEPTGCLPAAAAFGRRLDLRGKRVGLIVSGGNIDLASFATLIQGAA
jgi:threonine dehydratase